MAADHTVLPHDEWVEARKAFLVREKEFTRQRAALAQERRDLPWEAVTKEYVFDGPDGKATLPDLFDGRRQLIVYHFMFPPEWDEGCPHCSFWADNFDGIDVHLRHRDVAFVAASRAPLEKIEAFRARMGWRFTWVSSGRSDFNYDLDASFRPEAREAGTAFYNYVHADPGFDDREGISVFAREDGEVFHTYSTYARGIDAVNGAYQFLDLVPRGRDEERLEFTQAWVRHHDRYDR